MRQQILGAFAVVLLSHPALSFAKDDLPAQASTVATPAPEATPPYELRYRFDQNGALPPHTFVLKWAAASGNLQTIDVMISDTDQVLQTIAIPQDQVRLIWQEISSKPGATKDRIVDLIDYNFDKFADLRMLKRWPYHVGEKSYMAWLFNDKVNKYEFSEVLSALPNPNVDPKTKLVSSIKLTGYAGGEYEQRFFTLEGAGLDTKLVVQTKIVQTSVDAEHLVFQRDIRQKVHGSLQRTCKLRIPSEGKPQKMWGTTAACAPFMIKGAPKAIPLREVEEPEDTDVEKDKKKGSISTVKDSADAADAE
jgi:hypothetical protein